MSGQDAEADHRIDNLIGGGADLPEIRKLNLKPTPDKVSQRVDVLRNQITQSLNKLSAADLETRNRIIEHVGQAIVDISELENGERVEARKAETTLENLAESSAQLQNMLKEKQLDRELLGRIVDGLVELTGPNRDTTSLFLNLPVAKGDFHAQHAINSVLLSLSVAIELSKLMEQKITSPEVVSSLKNMQICNRKIFTRRELVEIGVSAFLHDIWYKFTWPKLDPAMQIGWKEKAVVDKHATEAYHFLKSHFPGLGFDVLKAIHQHHEFLDGTGEPNHVQGRFIARYSSLLSFTDFYLLRTTENPFERQVHPHNVLQSILTTARSRFDDDILLAFIRGAGFYPLSSWLLLNNGEIGVVIRSNPQSAKSPVVKTVLNSRLEPIAPKFHDLSASPLKIAGMVDFQKIRNNVADYRSLVLDGNPLAWRG